MIINWTLEAWFDPQDCSGLQHISKEIVGQAVSQGLYR